MSFLNKVLIMTGASSGIGAEAAKHLAKLGGQLVICGRNQEKLRETAKAIKNVGGLKALEIQGDMNNDADVRKIVDQTMERFGRINVLVNNAGIIEIGTIENTSIEQYDRIMNTNMRSVYLLTMFAAPHLIATKGCIVNISSVSGLRAFPGVLAYNLSKAALDQFTRCVALELAPKGVRCNSVNPGVTVTEIHKRGGMSEETYAEFLEHSRTTHALGRPGTVSEVANVISFLASDAASFVTGVTLSVDGGRHAMCPR